MSFYVETIATDPRYRSVEQIRDIALLEPATRAAVRSIVAAAFAEHGIALGISETFRSRERQAHLFATGASKLKDVGVHHYGLACDFFKIVDKKATWDGDWTFLRDLARRYGLISGLDWGHPERPHTFRDSDHVQRCRIEDQAKLFAGTWYPDPLYVCTPPPLAPTT